MTPVTGEITDLSIGVGRGDFTVSRKVPNPAGPGDYDLESYYVLADEVGCRLTLDGQPTTVGELAQAIARPTVKCTATLYPLVERYGACLRAEFITCKD